MAKKKSITEALDDWIGHKKECKKAREKPKEPITSEQLGEVELAVAYMSEEIAFLGQVFSDIPAELEAHHINGLGKILEHIHADSHKVLDLLEELDKQAVDK